jgi:hypothetical protein
MWFSNLRIHQGNSVNPLVIGGNCSTVDNKSVKSLIDISLYRRIEMRH